MDNPQQLCNTPNVPRPKRRTQGAAGALRGEGSQAVDTSTLAAVSPQLPEHPPRPFDALPQPWLIGTAEILAELERIRGLALAVPLTLASNGPVNSVVDALWRFEQELRYVLRLQAQAQSAFAHRSGGNKVVTGSAPRSGALPGIHA